MLFDTVSNWSKPTIQANIHPRNDDGCYFSLFFLPFAVVFSPNGTMDKHLPNINVNKTTSVNRKRFMPFNLLSSFVMLNCITKSENVKILIVCTHNASIANPIYIQTHGQWQQRKSHRDINVDISTDMFDCTGSCRLCSNAINNVKAHTIEMRSQFNLKRSIKIVDFVNFWYILQQLILFRLLLLCSLPTSIFNWYLSVRLKVWK